MEIVTPVREIVDAIKAAGGDGFKRCYQCGLCDTVCPWSKVRNFSMRKLVCEATFGLYDDYLNLKEDPARYLVTKDKKEGAHRVVFLVQPWECDPLYCPYSGNGCKPNTTQNISGDRLGYREEDGSLTYVERWVNKIPGWQKAVPSGKVIPKPRGKEE